MADSADSHQLLAIAPESASGSPTNNINDPMIPAKTRKTILVSLLLIDEALFMQL
jgi:hypothetical protein